MSGSESRNALLGRLLQQHGEQSNPEHLGPVVPNNNLSHRRCADNPFDLLSFIESQREHAPSLDVSIQLSDNQGHLLLRGLKSTKMAFAKMVKDKQWEWIDSNTTSEVGRVFFSLLCQLKTGCTLVRTAENEGIEAVNTTAHTSFFCDADPTRTKVWYMFLAWRIKFDGILFSGRKRALGVFYVYERDHRCSRFNTDGFILAWLPDDIDSFSCLDALDFYRRTTRQGFLPILAPANPLPLPSNIAHACKQQFPRLTAASFWDTVLLPFRHPGSDAYSSCMQSSHAALSCAAYFLLAEFYPLFAASASRALLVSWSAHDLQGGILSCFASDSTIFKAATAYLGTNPHITSLAPYLFIGAPPQFIKFLWSATTSLDEVHEAFYAVAIKEARIKSLLSTLHGDDRWLARLRAAVDIGAVILDRLRAHHDTSRHDATLGSKWRALLRFIAGPGVLKSARMLETVPRLRINSQILSNLILYVEKQVMGLAEALRSSDDNSLSARPDLAVGIVWMHTQADIVLARERIDAANVEGADIVLDHYRRLVADSPAQIHWGADDAQITAEHFTRVARMRHQEANDARKRKKTLLGSIDSALDTLRAFPSSGDAGPEALRALKRLRTEAKSL